MIDLGRVFNNLMGIAIVIGFVYLYYRIVIKKPVSIDVGGMVGSTGLDKGWRFKK